MKPFCAPVVAGWIALAVVAGAMPSARAAAPAAVRPARVVAAGERSITLRVTVPEPRVGPSPYAPGRTRVEIDGYGPAAAPPGAPSLPQRRFLVAVPPSGTVRVSARVVRSQPLGRVRLEPVPAQGALRDDDLGVQPVPDYRVTRPADWLPPPVVRAGAPGWMRRTRVVPIDVTPLVTDASGEASVAREIEVRVTWSRGAGDSGGPWGASAVPVGAPDMPLWDAILAETVVDPARARAWRLGRRRRASAARGIEATAQPGEVRVDVRRTGVLAVRASDLVAEGLPGGLALDGIRVFQRGYDDTTLTAFVRPIAFDVEEDAAGVPGVFDGDDRIVFYARSLRDDPYAGDPIEKFSDHNVYWIGPGAGVRMRVRTLTPAPVDGDTATATWPAGVHAEVDREFVEETPPGRGDDFYFANGAWQSGPIDLPFELEAPAPGTSAVLRVRVHGGSYSTRTVRLSLVNALGTNVVRNNLIVTGRDMVTLSQAISAGILAPGANTLRMSKVTSDPIDALLNWAELDYTALFRARGDALRFNTGTMTGDTVVTVTGLHTTDVRLYDVTDPLAPVRCDAPPAALVPTTDGGWALSFRDTLAARREYALVAAARIPLAAPADLHADTPSSLVGGSAEAGVDVLVVSHASFLGGMQRWVDYRRAQGYRVLAVDVQDVYDEFNNGVPGARAIDRFTRHFYELGGAGVLLLVGDASEDAKGVHPESGPNFVPTHSRPESVNIGGQRFDEIVTTDKLYGHMPPPGGGTPDAFPDVIVARLPVGSPQELDVVLDKIFAYENPTGDVSWRKRMVFIADDAWSAGGTVFGGSGTCYWPVETAFERGQEDAARVVERALPAGFDVVRFYLSRYTRPFHGDSTQCGVMFQSILFTRNNVTPLLFDELARGATLVSIQAHMNRYLVAHEKLLAAQSGNITGAFGGRDHLRIQNIGRPYVMMALGCHFSDFAIHKEQAQSRLDNNAPNGDSFGEQFLLAANRGAVGVWASTGYEFLSQTNDAMSTAARVWFYEAPFDTLVRRTQARWILGSMMFLVENAIAGRQPRPVERYHLLGDPLLRVDAGPPAFDVTVDGRPARSGDFLETGGAADTVHVRAVVTDENAIDAFRLTIDGVDRTSTLRIAPTADTTLAAARQYRVEFDHVPRASTYDIVLSALQEPDTAGGYAVTGSFTLRVQTVAKLEVDGREVVSGERVPRTATYRVTLTLPVTVPASQVSARLDSVPVTDATLSHPAPDDSTTWVITFRRTLDEGRHRLEVAAGPETFTFVVEVRSEPGLRDLIAWPNPFRDSTNFLFTADSEILEGTIDVFTVSGRRVRRIEIPPDARFPGRNGVAWDGRDSAGDPVANGVYLVVMRVRQPGGSATIRGKVARIR